MAKGWCDLSFAVPPGRSQLQSSLMKPIGQSNCAVRRVAAWVCLVAMALGPARVLPFALAWGASAEGSHAVRVYRGEDGLTKVVLGHRMDAAKMVPVRVQPTRPEQSHHHGWASSVLCWVTEARSTAGDHVASFADGGMAEVETKTIERRFSGVSLDANAGSGQTAWTGPMSGVIRAWPVVRTSSCSDGGAPGARFAFSPTPRLRSCCLLI